MRTRPWPLGCRAAAIALALTSAAIGQPAPAPVTAPADAGAAFDAWLAAATAGDVEAARAGIVLPPAGDAAREPTQRVIDKLLVQIESKGFPPRAGTLSRIEVLQEEDLAIVLARVRAPGRITNIEPFPMVRHSGQWKVIVAAPGTSETQVLPANLHDAFTAIERRAAARRSELRPQILADEQARVRDEALRSLALAEAAGNGDLAKVRALIDAGVDPASGVAATPLEMALRKHHREVAAYLVERGAPVPPKLVVSLLRTGDIEAATIAVDLGVAPNAIVADGPGVSTPLIQAIFAGEPTLVQTLLDRTDGPLKDQPRLRTTHLNAAVASGDLKTFELIAARYEKLTAVDAAGATALHALGMSGINARKSEFGAITSRLLDGGVDPHAVVPRVPWFEGKDATPLTSAAGAARDEAVMVLLERVKFDQAELNDALGHAIRWCQPPTVAALLGRGADAKALVFARRTSLHTAIERRSLEKVKLLIEQGGHPLEPRIEPLQRTPLHQAAAHGTAEIVQFLLDLGADARAMDAEGNDAVALAKIRLEKGREFIGRGRDPNAREYLAEFDEYPDEGRQIARLLGADIPAATTAPAP